LGESGFDVREGRAYQLRRCYALSLRRRWNLKQSLPAKIRRKREKILVLHREIQNMRQTVRMVSIIEVDAGVMRCGPAVRFGFPHGHLPVTFPFFK
jgi:hypothetical protein